jgi:hypothetical protein
VDPGKGDRHQLQVSSAVALLKVAQVAAHPPIEVSRPLGLFRERSIATVVAAIAGQSG